MNVYISEFLKTVESSETKIAYSGDLEIFIKFLGSLQINNITGLKIEHIQSFKEYQIKKNMHLLRSIEG